MSQENVELVLEAFRAFERGDIEWLVALSDPEGVIRQPPEVPDAKSYKGKAGLREAFADWPEQWDDYTIEVLRTRAVGDKVVAYTHQRGRGKGSGVEVEAYFTFVLTFRNGKVTEWLMFVDEKQALEAAGLSA